jgi:hypothetical protein
MEYDGDPLFPSILDDREKGLRAPDCRVHIL